jgi:hypothetical protein
MIYNKVIELYKNYNYNLTMFNEVFHLIDNKQTGSGITAKEIAYIEQYKNQFTSPNIFIIGNAFGFSTFAFNYIFDNASIDVIDAEIEGQDNTFGSEITRKIVQDNNFNIQLTKGFSPEDIYKSTRHSKYDIVFIDGFHTNEQILKDYYGIKPYLKNEWICFFHDVTFGNLQHGMDILINNEKDFYTQSLISLPSDLSESGIGILSRNIDIIS